MIFSHKHNSKCPALQHSGERALAFANGECPVGFVPCDRDRGEHAFFVVVAVVLIFVEREGSVRSAINPKLDWVGRLLGGILESGPIGRIDPARTNSGMRSSGAAASMVVPPSILRPVQKSYHAVLGQVHPARVCARFCNGSDQQRRAEHELRRRYSGARVAAEVHRQWAHRRVALARDLPRHRVDVGHQAIAQAVIADQDLLRLGAVGP